MPAKLTQSQFIQKVSALHPELDFSRSVYTLSSGEVDFDCPKHGAQKVRANNLLHGRGCPRCGRIRAAEKTLLPRVKALTPEQKAEMAARARAGRTEESNAKLAESQRRRWAAADDADRQAQAERGKKTATEMWANTTPEQRKEKMAAVRAAKKLQQ
jgi:hypothetical protein